MNSRAAIDCPFCGHKNQCQAQSQQACWCFEHHVPSALIALLPEHLQGKKCICLHCIKLFKEDPLQFSTKHQKA